MALRNMRIDLPYGEGHLSLDVQGYGPVETFTPRSAVPIHDLDQCFWRMLGTQHDFVDLSGHRLETATIIVDGPRSLTPAHHLLSCLVPYLESLNLDASEITLLMSNALGDDINQSESIELLRKINPSGCRIEVHDPGRNDATADVGCTPTHGTPIQVNRCLIDSDIRLAVSSVVPDGFAGATGGSMSVLPGVVSERTRVKHRRLSMTAQAKPLDVSGPALTDMNECADLVGLDLIVNVVLDWRGNPAHVIGGRREVWQEGVEALSRVARVPFQRKMDIAVVSVGGAPYDRTLYSSIDSLLAALTLTRRDGAIVLLAECEGGVGPSGLLKGISEYDSETELVRSAEDRFEVGMEKARLFWQSLESRRLVLCTRLKQSLVSERLHCEAVRDPEEGLEIARNHVGRTSGIAVVPSGACSVPFMP